ncbi:MAG: hypothetical protein ACFB6S_09315 [Geminicoccaceae bacterium]
MAGSVMVPWALVWQWLRMSLAAATTITMRSFTIGQAMIGQKRWDEAELRRMWMEKMQAATEATIAMATMDGGRLLSSMGSKRAGSRMAGAMTRPYARRASANARRLTRPSRKGG